jgi:hypothetical protein
MKNLFSVPSSWVVLIFAVDAAELPPPPAEDTVVLVGSKASRSATAGSRYILSYQNKDVTTIVRYITGVGYAYLGGKNGRHR